MITGIAGMATGWVGMTQLAIGRSSSFARTPKKWWHRSSAENLDEDDIENEDADEDGDMDAHQHDEAGDMDEMMMQMKTSKADHPLLEYFLLCAYKDVLISK